MANSLAFLQIDLGDPDFHRLALAGAVRMRDELRSLLDDAVGAGELAPADTAALAAAVQTTYNGALVTWAIFREPSLEVWLRQQLETLLRTGQRELHST